MKKVAGMDVGKPNINTTVVVMLCRCFLSGILTKENNLVEEYILWFGSTYHRGKGKRIKLNKREIENLHKHTQGKSEEDQNEKEEMM